MKGACREEHSHCVLLQAPQSFSQECWKGLQRVSGSAGGMESHRLLCQVRTAVPGHGEMAAGSAKQDARCCRGSQEGVLP